MATKEHTPAGARSVKPRPSSASRAREPASSGAVVVASGPLTLRQGTPETEETEG